MQASRFLITGGSQGIGGAIVELASKAGHKVVFTGRNEELIEKVAREDRRAWAPRATFQWETTTPGLSRRAGNVWAESTSSSTTPGTPTGRKSAPSTSTR